MLHEGASISYENLLNEIQGFASPEVVLATESTLHLKIAQQDLEKIAALDSVQAIEKAPEITLFNDQAKAITRVNGVNEALLAAKQTGLTGTGQVVAIVDSGIDAQHDAFKGK